MDLLEELANFEADTEALALKKHELSTKLLPIITAMIAPRKLAGAETIKTIEVCNGYVSVTTSNWCYGSEDERYFEIPESILCAEDPVLAAEKLSESKAMLQENIKQEERLKKLDLLRKEEEKLKLECLAFEARTALKSKGM